MSRRVQLRFTPGQKRKATSALALATGELEAAEALISKGLLREAVSHLYFTSFYVSVALLSDKERTDSSHKRVESQLHRYFGRRQGFPRRYVKLHSRLHKARTEFSYRTAHSPEPAEVATWSSQLGAFLRFALRTVPRVSISDLLTGLLELHPVAMTGLSFDVYCPKTYYGHTRITAWQPSFYTKIFSVHDLATHSKAMLRKLRVRRVDDYVVGLNSRVDQYEERHILMLDIDTLDKTVEAALKPIGGFLLKSGQGFHFIGTKLIVGDDTWRKTLRKLARSRGLKRYVDQNFVDFSIRRGHSTLRITSSPVKPREPLFYKEL